MLDYLGPKGFSQINSEEQDTLWDPKEGKFVSGKFDIWLCVAGDEFYRARATGRGDFKSYGIWPATEEDLGDVEWKLRERFLVITRRCDASNDADKVAMTVG